MRPQKQNKNKEKGYSNMRPQNKNKNTYIHGGRKQ